MSLLEVTGLRVRYGRIPVVHGVDFRVGEGSVVGLLGANGAGKTTIMRALLGQRSSTGRVTFAGERIDGLAPHRVGGRGVALVPEGRKVFRTLTVEKNLRMGSYPLGREASWRDQAGLDPVLELFGELEPLLARRAGELSGGQQQMVAIGRALMGRPRLLIMDEPSLGLAPLVIERIYEAVRMLRASRTSILLAEQNARLALRSVDRAYVIQRGRITEEGSAEELRTSRRVEEIYLGGSAPGNTGTTASTS
ncbi:MULTISPECIES: ABC transporter ATP-binding protein [Amycolatopsis methanolica group]|uniref:ABC transporter ATP-binding protein n=1 Tax=Amycolatopsis methanolica group TaxID=2893674 RepID=UPI00342DCD2A